MAVRYSRVRGRLKLDCVAILPAHQAATEMPGSDAPAVGQLVQSACKSVEAAKARRIDGDAYGVAHFDAPVEADVMLLMLSAQEPEEAASRQERP
jgi:hypothetical protein